LEATPTTLEELYAQSMRRLESFAQETGRLAKSCFAWLLLSKEDLEITQLRHALGVGERPSDFDKDNLPAANEIVKVCGGLVTLSGGNSSIVFSHSTVRDYLLDRLHDWAPDAEETVARGCIDYLNLDAFRRGRCDTDETFESRLRDFPLYRYAARHWGHYLRDIPTSILSPNEILSFLMDTAKVDSASQAVLAPENAPLQVGYSQDTPKRMTGLHLAAYFGLVVVIELLLAQGQKPISNDSEHRTPLWRATEKGHSKAMALLSRRDRITFSSMLAQRQNELAASLFIVAGQNIKDLQGRTALHMGAIYEDLDIMKLALQNSSSIDPEDDDGKTPLELAIQGKKRDATEWLLQECAGTTRVTASAILSSYEKMECKVYTIVKLCKDKSGSKELDVITHEKFQQELTSPISHQTRLL
jgi:hypothetical protein